MAYPDRKGLFCSSSLFYPCSISSLLAYKKDGFSSPLLLTIIHSVLRTSRVGHRPFTPFLARSPPFQYAFDRVLDLFLGNCIRKYWIYWLSQLTLFVSLCLTADAARVRPFFFFLLFLRSKRDRTYSGFPLISVGPHFILFVGKKGGVFFFFVVSVFVGGFLGGGFFFFFLRGGWVLVGWFFFFFSVSRVAFSFPPGKERKRGSFLSPPCCFSAEASPSFRFPFCMVCPPIILLLLFPSTE